MNDAAHVLRAVVREVEAGRSAALCVIVSARGSTPQPAGTMVCVDEGTALTGTLGGGCVEADVRRQAHALLAARQSKVITFALDDDFGYDDGMICGGQLEVAVSIVPPSADVALYRRLVEELGAGEAVTLSVHVGSGEQRVEYRIHLEAAPKLLIVGAGHIGRVLARLMVPLGFSVDVIDDRAVYANVDRFPHPIRTTVGDTAATLRSWPMDSNTYVVVVTRGHRHDEEALQAVLGAPLKYLGMIGSRRKVQVTFDELKHRGATEQQLSRVHAPIGLDIGSITPEEIALSIAAQLVSVRRSNKTSFVEGPVSCAEDRK